LYFNGNAIPADKTEAQSWHAKTQSCQGGNLALLQQQLAQYRARAAAAPEPLFFAIPVIPKSAPVAFGNRNRNRTSSSVNPYILAGIATGFAIVAAVYALRPSENANSGDAEGSEAQALDAMRKANSDAMACAMSGGTQNLVDYERCSGL